MDQHYYCHKCNTFITRLYNNNKCHICRDEFIEEIDHNDRQAMSDLYSISQDSNRTDEVFEELVANEELPTEESWRSTHEPRAGSEYSFLESDALQRLLPIPLATFSILVEEFGFDPQNFVVNAGDVLSRILEQIMGTGSQPMTPTDIESIPIVEISEDQQNDIQCAICIEKLKPKEKVRKLICNHFFHSGCIKPWLSIHSNCPICRQDLNVPFNQ